MNKIFPSCRYTQACPPSRKKMPIEAPSLTIPL